MANTYQAQIREISKKQENEEDRRFIYFHNYGSDLFVCHYLNMKCLMGSNIFITIVYRFIKFGWIVLLKDKKTKSYTGYIQICISIHNVPTTL